MFDIMIHTDGACSGNPGIGGYGAIIVCKGHEKIVAGYKEYATNNAMELQAVVEALKALTKPCQITVSTDSQYLCSCVKHNKAWLTAENRPNRDLWVELIEVGLKGKHKIKFVKTKGHSGDPYNERCDKIAKEQIVKARHALYDEK